MNEQNQDNLTLLEARITDIINELPLEAKVSIANLGEEELRILELVQGKYLKYRLDQFADQGNDELLNECRELSGDMSMDDIGASAFILRKIMKTRSGGQTGYDLTLRCLRTNSGASLGFSGFFPPLEPGRNQNQD